MWQQTQVKGAFNFLGQFHVGSAPYQSHRFGDFKGHFYYVYYEGSPAWFWNTRANITNRLYSTGANCNGAETNGNNYNLCIHPNRWEPTYTSAAVKGVA